MEQLGKIMSIQNILRLIHRVDKIVSELKIKYSHKTGVSHDLNKLSEALKKLEYYLEKLDELKPNKTTNEIDIYMRAVNLELDILKSELAKSDYKKLYNGMKVVKTALKFHPTKYSFFERIILWFYEFIYFI
jgi:hypothetical protein